MAEGLDETEVLFNALPAAAVAVDGHLRIVRMNDTALKHTGLKRDAETPTLPCYRVLYKRSAVCPYCPLVFGEKQNEAYLEQNVADRIIHLEEEGEERTYRLSFYPVNSSRVRLLEVVEDITKERENIEETLRMEKLASLGAMISGIAHELNNPLTGIGLTLQNLEANMSVMSTPEILGRLALMRKDLKKAAQIVRDILSFARPGPLKRSPGDIVQILNRAKENTIRLYPVLSRRVDWCFDGEKSLILPLDPDKVERLFINLFKNALIAFDYSPGNIRVEVKRARKWAHIVVEDDAGGISTEDLRQIFNPFFTRSRDGAGSGLGLTICHSIVKEHGGRIRAFSVHGKSNFYISLPLATGDAT